jgi:hypothetical protein
LNTVRPASTDNKSHLVQLHTVDVGNFSIYRIQGRTRFLMEALA